MRKQILKTEGRKRVKAAAVVRMFKTVEAEYGYDAGDVFCEDSPKVAALKRIVAGLDTVDRTIIVLYCELQSTAELWKVLHVSKRTAARAVQRIKKEILDKYNQLKAKQHVLP